MKLICLEEHAVDADIDEATRSIQVLRAPYLADVDSQFQDVADETHDILPHLVTMKEATAQGLQLGVERIAQMDRHGIDVQVLSYSSAPQLAPAHTAVGLAQRANDRLAAAVRAYPTRFRAFATLPWQVTDQAVIELERAVHDLGMVGTLLIGRPGETFLDDARYEPIIAKLNQLKVPLYVHPGVPLPEVREPYYGGLNKEVSARLSLFGWGWHNEAGVHVIRMMLAGLFDNYPDLQVISGHWGEMVPFYLQRLDDCMPQGVTGLKRSLTETYRQHIYVTPSGMLNLPHFEFILKVLGADRILYAVDYPYLTLSGARGFIEELPISEADREKIASANAELLLGSAL